MPDVPCCSTARPEPAWRWLDRVTRAAAAADCSCDGRGRSESGAGDDPEDGMAGDQTARTSFAVLVTGREEISRRETGKVSTRLEHGSTKRQAVKA